MDDIYGKLFEDKLISNKQYEYLDEINSHKRVSLYHDLRFLLYLGIILFTSGVGYYTYINLGDIVHILMMSILLIGIIASFYFITKFSKPYSNYEVIVEQGYFDYILILASLLIISLFTYIQVYFELVELLLKWTSYSSAIIFIFMAYRYDNRVLLSMGVTAITTSLGLIVSPMFWLWGDGVGIVSLYLTSISLGILLTTIGQLSYYKRIKSHFRYTYQHFGILLYLIGFLVSMFLNSDIYLVLGIILIVTASFISYYSWINKELPFFIYSSIAVYIAFTFSLFKGLYNLDGEFLLLLFYYLPASFILYPVLLLKHKSHFAHE